MSGYPKLCQCLLACTGITQDNWAARRVPALPRPRSRPSRLPPCQQQCWFSAHQALAYGSLETCPRELLLRAACHTGAETRPGPPCRSQPMHTKREMVCICLQEAMLIDSTTLTMTRMAPSQTSLRSMWALVSAVQVVQTTGRLKWRPSRFFI